MEPTEPTELTDEQLVAKFRISADMGIFKILVRRYQARVYSIALRTLGNNEEAEEVVQETFLKVHQSLDKYRQNALFSSWLYRIAHNQCMDVMRMKQRTLESKAVIFDPQSGSSAGEEVSTDSSRDTVTQLADRTPDPAQKLDINEQTQIVEKSLAMLPEAQKMVLVLHDMQGLSYQEVSEIVGTSIGTVRSRLHYGRLKLRELLEPYFSNESAHVNFPITAR
ncbi:MAG: sigma-70 family RNA polymerase sigma factor [Cyanobacteria bacterium REEB67]|nr:sigma-70 family RNA polymerase sigma factor [Cyanobacteria bacterium REEB67]